MGGVGVVVVLVLWWCWCCGGGGVGGGRADRVSGILNPTSKVRGLVD